MADVLEALLVATGGLLSIGSALLVLTLLSTSGGVGKAAAYVTGNAAAYCVIGVVFLGVGSVASGSEGAGEGISVGPVLSVALGAFLLFFGARRWRQGQEGPSKLPRVFQALDTMSRRKAMGFGASIAVINFKNLALFLAAVSVLGRGELSPLEQVAGVVAVVVVFCGGLITPVLVAAVFAEAVRDRLLVLRTVLERHNRPLSIGVMLLFGSFFLVRGVYGLW